MVMIAKLVMRPNDTSKGRAIKLTNYIDLHKRLIGGMPQDISLFVRKMSDIPLTMKEDIENILKKTSWNEHEIPDPTLLARMIRKSREA